MVQITLRQSTFYNHLLNHFIIMNLITYNPFFTTKFNNWLSDTDESYAPSVNIVEKENGFFLDVVSPGMAKSDFKIEVKNKQLTVSAEKQKSNETVENDKVWRKEYTLDSFTRSFYLPATVNAEAIEANYDQGILKVFIPKKPEAIPTVKTIEVA